MASSAFSGNRLQSAAFALLPTALRIQGRAYFRNLLLDLREQLTGKNDPEIPPRHLNISGDGPFRLYGKNIVDLCRQHGALAEDDVVLDIGCGIGRTALALTPYLTGGEYFGFDIIQFAIEWCQKRIAARHPSFHFAHADISNRTYNPRGRVPAEQFVFPYADEMATFALATSLFTHVLPATVENYLAQTGRVLKPGGHFLSTWFLLDAEIEDALRRGQTQIRFDHRFVGHAQTSLHAPEQAVAFPREWVEQQFAEHGFAIQKIFRGDWTGRPDKVDSMQDLVICVRR